MPYCRVLDSPSMALLKISEPATGKTASPEIMLTWHRGCSGLSRLSS